MFLAQFLGIGSIDLQYINELLETIAGTPADNQLKEDLADLPLGQIDANTLINAIFYGINQAVYWQIKEQIEKDRIAVSSEAEKAKLISLCEERIDEFSPYINCVDSHFNNELDQVSVRENTLDQIVNHVIPFLLENARS